MPNYRKIIALLKEVHEMDFYIKVLTTSITHYDAFSKISFVTNKIDYDSTLELNKLVDNFGKWKYESGDIIFEIIDT